MVIKSIILILLYTIPYFLIISGWFNPGIMLGLCFVMGIGMAGIGFSVAHDALHGSYSKNKNINRLLGFSFDLLGANGYVWKITHNVIHHTYTNINEHDMDLNVAGFIRLCPHVQHKPIHRLQHILAFFAYSTATLFWVFVKDYQLFTMKKLGPYNQKKHPASEWVVLITTKIFYYSYFFVVPALVLHLAWWQLAIGYLTVHFTAGVILGIIFQLAHTVEGVEFPLANQDQLIEEGWMAHEMETTSDFARKNKLLSWYIGGLNFQVEHHLFPRICSIHYPKISQIVEDTAKEFGVPYHSHPTLRKAIQSHYRILRKYGRPDSNESAKAA